MIKELLTEFGFSTHIEIVFKHYSKSFDVNKRENKLQEYIIKKDVIMEKNRVIKVQNYTFKYNIERYVLYENDTLKFQRHD